MSDRKFIVGYKLTDKVFVSKRWVGVPTNPSITCFDPKHARVFSHLGMIARVRKLRQKGIKEIFIREVYDE